ncbi:MAG: SIMPL domain-containing protein [Patescibacteria group bacterium]|nr:SIMPL domain-containing protein [Patescibacteria group bacterium]
MKSSQDTVGKAITLIVFFFVVLFAYTKLAGPIPFYINSVNTTKTDLFSVEGTGTATAVPDSGVVNFGVTQTATTVALAQSKTNEIANKLIADIKNLGIAEKDIKTTNYSVNPNYGSNPRPLAPNEPQTMMYPVPPTGSEQQIIGYTVTQNLEIDVKQMDKINKVVDTVTGDGANLVNQVSFSFSDEMKAKLENKARADAIKEAKQKAQNLANLSGIRLGRLVNVVESNQVRPWPMPMMQAGKATADQSAPPTNITPGESTVSITVTLSYETF